MPISLEQSFLLWPFLLAHHPNLFPNQLLPGLYLWDNHVLWPLSSHAAPHCQACLLKSLFALYHCIQDLWWCMFNCLLTCQNILIWLLLALHNLSASHQFYCLAGRLPVSPGNKSHSHHQPFGKYFSPFSCPSLHYFKSCVCVCLCLCAYTLSRVRLFATPWTVAHQAPLSIGVSRQEYWAGCHFLLQGILPTQVSNLCLLGLLHWQVDPSLAEPSGSPPSLLTVSNPAKLQSSPLKSSMHPPHYSNPPYWVPFSLVSWHFLLLLIIY